MKLCFILTGVTRAISGGYKMCYEYANRMCELGYDCTILYNNDTISRKNNILRKKIDSIYRKSIFHKEPSWFELNKRIKKVMINSSKEISNYNFDIYIICTSYNVFHLTKYIKNGKKIALIQDYENWDLSEQELIQSYNMVDLNITVSKWLHKIVEKNCGVETICISNPIDSKKFYLETEITKRENTIAMLYHTQKRKGSIYGIEVCKNIKKKYPNTKFIFFGFPKRGKEIPEWIEYRQKVNSDELRKIYNQSKIFLCTSLIEGYGLTGLESMLCGCALVSTRTKGVEEYAISEMNSILVDVGDVEQLINAVERLLHDDCLRMHLANNAVTSSNRYSWEQAVKKFEKYIIHSSK
ncbi:glycosyltransferase family 4 protein [Enterococcus cecorum]|uniref:glycosyltransferase family 4 protein n=1 Tax=Enterococcus cecorum TaxID=44008 RepID=UPI000AC09250|nr:glycosyltransferase family 4 protein [Enterococcus cecorum]MDZ5561308.1 glycosyltransferase family 4 protein [Enterococcus cecorum]CAI3377624.1 glycosyltransferase family 4 protein [Enterococcus cecorum]CAI3428269.1 glycosyltransferase family 4 protein [Enterococcus cecorum]CAI3433255.1 glycosyltransferase family 4 protein [Enterococcus cecorum]STP86557.1 group 1 glycosyl transferase [Enterococcus cecorum]